MADGRSQQIVMTPKAHVLRELREEAGLSMRAAGELIAKSSTWISHLENGRADISEETAMELVRAYARHSNRPAMTYRSFQERARKYQRQETTAEFIKNNIDRISEDDAKILKLLLEQFLAKK